MECDICFFFFVLILWNGSCLICYRLVSPSAVGLGEKWNGRIVFGDVMQSERGLFAMFVAITKWSKNARIFVEKVPCFTWNK